MLNLLLKKKAIVRHDISKADAIENVRDRNEEYKVELISELEDGTISTYTQGNFTDLCRGPHLPNTAPIKAVKITSLAGAYGEAMRTSSVDTYLWHFFPEKENVGRRFSFDGRS